MVDPKIKKRFAELETAMADVKSSIRTGAFYPVADDALWHEWCTSVLNLIVGVMGEESDHYKNFRTVYDNKRGDTTGNLFPRAKGVFSAASRDYEGGYLLNMASMVSADVIDDVLDQAQHLLDNDYKDPACVIGRVALESALKRLCKTHKLPTGKLDKMNSDLARANVYNKSTQKYITAWSGLGNDAAHGNWSAYTNADVGDQISGVRRFIAQHL